MRYEFDINQLQRLKARYDPKVVEKAFEQSIDRSTAKAATHISRDVRDDYHVSAANIKKTLTVKRARRHSSAALLYVGERMPLDRFNPRVTRPRVITATSRRGNKFKTRRRGVSVKIRKDTGRKMVPGGWFAKGRVMSRSESIEDMSMAGLDGSEVFTRLGPSIPGMVSHPRVIESAQDMVREDLPRQFSGRMDYLLGRQQ